MKPNSKFRKFLSTSILMLVQKKAFIPRISFECDKHKQPSVKGVRNWTIFLINSCVFSKLKDFLPKLNDFSYKLKIKETPLSWIAGKSVKKQAWSTYLGTYCWYIAIPASPLQNCRMSADRHFCEPKDSPKTLKPFYSKSTCCDALRFGNFTSGLNCRNNYAKGHKACAFQG